MEKVPNQLFLNYSRPNGKPFSAVLNGVSRSLTTGAVHVFPEVLVPGASSAEHDMLTALSNSLYLEARSHNMSLSPYGHLDPVKIALAGTFVGILMTDAIGDLSVIGKYSFSNVSYGRILAAARDISLASTEQDFANLCKRFNMLVAKVNSLYIPVTGFARRWYEHRRNIYKDDEGDRYSLYTYYLQNYYELIVDPTDTNAGRLVCRFREHSVTLNGDDLTTNTFLSKLQVIEQLVDNYLGDDDVANFCSEALHAGLPHLEFAPLKSVTHVNESGEMVEQFVGPELKLVYDLDDILGLENSCFIQPTAVDYVKSGTAAYLNWATWDIYEDVQNNKLICGSTNGLENQLPGFSVTVSTVHPASESWNIGDRPLYTHAKITSLPGLTNLTRYVVATGEKVIKSAASSTTQVKTYFNGYVVAAYNFAGLAATPITVHGTEMLAGHFAIRMDNSGFQCDETKRVMQLISEATDIIAMASVSREASINVGFKARFATYWQGGSFFVSAVSDFDYVTSISNDAMATFFGANAWNDTMLVKSIDKAYDGDKSSK